MPAILRPLLAAALAATALATIPAPAAAQLPLPGTPYAGDGLASLATPPGWYRRRNWGAYADAGNQAETAVRGDAVAVGSSTPTYNATARADFFNSTVQASVFTNERGVPGGCQWVDPDCRWGTTATAMIWDEVTIRPSRIAGPVTWDFRIDGTGDRGRVGWWGAEAGFQFSTVKSASIPAQRLGNGEVTFSGRYELGDAPVKFYFLMQLNVLAYNGAYADYGHTMRFDWTLPEGATYTSASGAIVAPTFVPAPTTAPEPATAALLAAGVAMLAAGARRRRLAGA